MVLTTYHNLQSYFGDIHNHCNLSYGKGTLREAFDNARLQLDFTSVTVHGHWDDLPVGDARLDYLVAYHQNGFTQAAQNWPAYVEATEAANIPSTFVTFPSFEWHSMAYGDHCMYFRDASPPAIYHVATIEQLRENLRVHGSPAFMLPHHVGYKTGYRGINWAAFTAEFSPVVEMLSFHGNAEHSDATPAYLHAMGPRDEHSTIQYALQQGRVFGLIGSTDHHSAHPGSYGYGLMGVWAEALTRHAIWDAIAARRTVAMSGDRVRLMFAVNEQPMGSVMSFTPERWIDVSVDADASIDYIEVLHNNRVVHRESVLLAAPDYSQPQKIVVEMGWGESTSLTDWAVDLRVESGVLQHVQPRLRGHDIGVPLDEDANCAFSSLHVAGNTVQLTTQTPRNPTVSSAATQALVLFVEGTQDTRIVGTINESTVDLPLSELETGARSTYLSGFVSPAFVFQRAIPAGEYRHRFAFMHQSPGNIQDWYYVRVKLKNGHGAWCSPIWLGKANQ